MTLDVGLRYGHRLAGLVGVSGYVHRPDDLMENLGPAAREVPLLVTHGELDPIVPFGPAKAQFEQLKASGIRLDWHAFRKVHTIDGERELQVIRDFVKRCFDGC